MTLTTSRPQSLVWAVGHDWDRALARVPGPSQSIESEYLAPAGDTFWTQKLNAAVASGGDGGDRQRHRTRVMTVGT